MIFLLASCEKEKSSSGFFNPTGHVVGNMGTKSSFSITVPQNGTYFTFFSNDTLWHNITRRADPYFNYLVDHTEMKKIFKAFSDTTIFHWKEWGDNEAYPAGHCMIGIIEPGIKDLIFMNYACSINNDSSTLKILNELAKTVTGDAQIGFNAVIDTIEAGEIKDEKYFDTARLESLDLSDIDFRIWGNEDTLIRSTDHRYINQQFPGYLKGITFTGNGKYVEIAVYQSQEVATNAMEQKHDFQDVWSDRLWYKNEIIRWNVIIAVAMKYQNFDHSTISKNIEIITLDLEKKVEDLCEFTE